MKEKKEIKICSCGAPLMWTFLYNGAEYFCPNCHYKHGMMGAGEYVEETTQLKAERRVVEKVFLALRPFLIGDGSFTRDNCKKCKAGIDRYHTGHLSKKETAENKIAQQILEHLTGYYKSN